MAHEFLLPHSLQVPGLNLDQYFGLWAIAIDPFQALVDRWNGTNILAHVANPSSQAAAASQAAKEFQITAEGIAVLDVRGTLMKAVSSMSDGTSLSYLRRQIQLAAGDPTVAGIMLLVDSPGGTTAGTADVADALNRAKKSKPVMAYVEDRAASAAVWIASQADLIYANQDSAVYGSIGVYATLLDQSKRAEQLGIKVHVIRTGPNKGAGVPGDAVTPEQLANLQGYVDAVHSQFLAAVASGRRRTVGQIQEHADGGIFTAASAVSRGLIDGVKTFDAAYAELVGMARSRMKPAPNAGARKMTQENAQPQAATIAELKAACPGAPSDWLLAQIEASATLAAAQAAFIAHQAKQLDEAKAAAAKAADEAKQRQAGGLGVSLQTARRSDATSDDTAASDSGDPVADFHHAVRAALPRCGGNRMQAVQTVARERPDLHKAFLVATNDRRAQGLIDDRFKATQRA